ncbi:MAG: L,D-transpeptidase family protein, partial [Oscillospiraceae bacterium]|nr:L,D-transpeptidase family protein [Oscillospiraceae bacterium]
YYTVPVRGMVCATGREGSETPLGIFALGSRYEWINMYGSTYVRYAVWFCEDNYFQSAGYSDTEKDALIAEEYNVIGTSATYGSVRLELADVKWIYDNCADGTTVVVYESDDPGPFGYCDKAVSAITAETDNGWEPTDPYIFNPWKYPEPTIVLAESAITISVYDCHTVEARVFPLGTAQNIVWSSSDEAVAQVDSKGVVYAASEGTAVITAKSGKLRADCAVTVAPRDANDPGIYPPKASNGLSYCIRVNTKTDTVTVLGLDEDGYYTVPVKNMICSTGKPGEETPLGTYSIYAKHRWVNMVDDSWGQYCSVFNGNIMFHSVCYYSKNTNDLIWNEYNDLGTNVSLGCVRLQVIDAKWIYDNCGDGTYVVVVDSDYPGPLGRGEKVIDYIPPEYNNGWEPTDPDPANPWLGRVPESIALDRTELKLDAHGTARLAVTATPAAAKELGIKFTSSDNSVATV